MLKVRPLQFGDNLNYLLRSSSDPSVLGVVDLANGLAVIRELQGKGQQPTHLFLTHHHPDHIDHLADFLAHFPCVQVFQPRGERRIPCEGVEMDSSSEPRLFGDLPFQVITTAAHTQFCAAYVFDSEHLFTGDALFEAGCGRLFEGGAEELEQGMDRFAVLPQRTKLYFGHDYAEVNLKFAQTVEPNNREIQARMVQVRARGFNQEPEIGGSLGSEKLVNPFLRVDEPAVISKVDPEGRLSRKQRLLKLRQQRDHF